MSSNKKEDDKGAIDKSGHPYFSREKSLEQARLMEMVKPFLVLMDEEYLERVGNETAANAHRYDSMAAVNRNYSPIKSELMRKQGECLVTYANLIKGLKSVDEIKGRLRGEKDMMEEMDNLFG